MGWLGVVETPDGSAGVTLGSFGISTSNLVIMSTATEDRNTGCGESRFDDQRFFTDTDIVFLSNNEETGTPRVSNHFAILLTDEPGLNGDPSLTSDGHTIQTSEKASLVQGEGTSLVEVVVNHNTTDQSEIGKSGSVVDGATIPVSDIDLSRNLASPGGDGTSTNLQLFDFDVLTLQPFPAISGFRGEASGLIETNLFITFAGTRGLAQSKDQQNQSALQHSPSFGSLTLPPDRKAVNQYAI
jgi:hypothetical protein